jgi:hypothetical protein
MTPIELAALGTPVLALPSRAIEPMLRQTFRRAVWLSGLGFQLYLGLNTIEVIDAHPDTSFAMTICGPAITTLYTRYTTVAGVCIALVYFIAMIAVTMALQASFYWSWGNGWGNWRVERAAYWMWGPIEEDSCEIDLAKGVSLSSTLPPPESPKLVVA